MDPDTNTPIENAKKPRIELAPQRKKTCLKVIVEMYEALMKEMFGQKAEGSSTRSMDIDGSNETYLGALNCITTGNHVLSIIFTIHNICRQRLKNVSTNMITKTATTSFKVRYCGKDYPITNIKVENLWAQITKENGLEYKNYDVQDNDNWYGTMGPYLDMFSAYALRVNELRLGHNNMPISKSDGIHKSFPVTKYGLSGAHHVLLEGTSFPPERRSSIVQSLGPMTAWLCMVRSEGVYRRKYAMAVKRAMSHIPCIDELIELTKNTKQASEIAAVTTLVAEILLVTTARQATRMFYPITLFAAVYKQELEQDRFLGFFSSTGAGGWYTYKRACEINCKWTLAGEMEEEKAAQIVFHGIFGTYKEDLSILEMITNVSNWFTREDMGGCFKKQGTCAKLTRVTLPGVLAYSKMSCANQTGLLSGVYNQVATVPCFSGRRTHAFDSGFFDHIEKRKVIGSSGKSLNQIMNILTSTLEELHDMLRKKEGKLEMGTTTWRTMSDLGIENPGTETTVVVKGKSKMFLGKRND